MWPIAIAFITDADASALRIHNSVYAMAMCLSVCYKPMFNPLYWNGWMDRVDFQQAVPTESAFGSFGECGYLQKSKVHLKPCPELWTKSIFHRCYRGTLTTTGLVNLVQLLQVYRSELGLPAFFVVHDAPASRGSSVTVDTFLGRLFWIDLIK